jgi:hypothetical protein
LRFEGFDSEFGIRRGKKPLDNNSSISIKNISNPENLYSASDFPHRKERNIVKLKQYMRNAEFGIIAIYKIDASEIEGWESVFGFEIFFPGSGEDATYLTLAQNVIEDEE